MEENGSLIIPQANAGHITHGQMRAKSFPPRRAHLVKATDSTTA